MKNILIKMSRRRSLMVPVVTLLAISIGISGYYIQDKQIAAKLEQEKTANVDQSEALETFDTTKPEKKQTPVADDSPHESSTIITEEGEEATVVPVKIEIEEDAETNEIIIKSAIQSNQPGICAVYLKQANYGPEDSVKVISSSCQSKLKNPGPGKWEAKVLFTSDDGKTRGDATQSVEL